MNELSKGMKEIANLIKLFFNRADVLQLIQMLMKHYDIKAQELSVTTEKVEESKQQETILKIISNVGVVLPSGKLLFLDGSENKGSISDAIAHKRKLPKGYDWHLMTKAEFEECKACQPYLNDALRKMKGLPITYPDSSYLLADNNLERSYDNLEKGYVRYCANKA